VCTVAQPLWRGELNLCAYFVGGSVVVVSDPCSAATFSAIIPCF
jgi:hypothetical protein